MWPDLTSVWTSEINVIEEKLTFSFFCDYWASTQWPVSYFSLLPFHITLQHPRGQMSKLLPKLDCFHCSKIVLLWLFPEWNSTSARLYVHIHCYVTQSTLTHGLWVTIACLSDFLRKKKQILFSLCHYIMLVENTECRIAICTTNICWGFLNFYLQM